MEKKIVRRKDREQDENFALMVADKCEYAIMSMVLEDGSPYCIPLSIARDGDFIVFSLRIRGTENRCSEVASVRLPVLCRRHAPGGG